MTQVEAAALGWNSLDPLRPPGGDARHQDAVGDGKAAAKIRHDHKLLIGPAHEALKCYK
jgi:hypothetical protein